MKKHSGKQKTTKNPTMPKRHPHSRIQQSMRRRLQILPIRKNPDTFPTMQLMTTPGRLKIIFHTRKNRLIMKKMHLTNRHIIMKRMMRRNTPSSQPTKPARKAKTIPMMNV